MPTKIASSDDWVEFSSLEIKKNNEADKSTEIFSVEMKIPNKDPKSFIKNEISNHESGV
jgi:hypothetical protein